MDLAEDIELGLIIEDRKAEREKAVEVSLDELQTEIPAECIEGMAQTGPGDKGAIQRAFEPEA